MSIKKKLLIGLLSIIPFVSSANTSIESAKNISLFDNTTPTQEVSINLETYFEYIPAIKVGEENQKIPENYFNQNPYLKQFVVYLNKNDMSFTNNFFFLKSIYNLERIRIKISFEEFEKVHNNYMAISHNKNYNNLFEANNNFYFYEFLSQLDLEKIDSRQEVFISYLVDNNLFSSETSLFISKLDKVQKNLFYESILKFTYESLYVHVSDFENYTKHILEILKKIVSNEVADEIISSKILDTLLKKYLDSDLSTIEKEEEFNKDILKYLKDEIGYFKLVRLII